MSRHPEAMPRICLAVREAVEEVGMTQGEIANAVGEKQQTISDWTKKREPRLDDLLKLEDALGLSRGHLVRAAGYVECPGDARSAIAGELGLIPSQRDFVLRAYEIALGLSDEHRKARSPKKRPTPTRTTRS